MESPIAAARFPHQRLEVMLALADLSVARSLLAREPEGNAVLGRLGLVWNALAEDYPISQANLNIGAIFVAGDEIRLLAECGTKLEEFLDGFRQQGHAEVDWRSAVADGRWPEIEGLAARALIEMVRNWALPSF